MQYRVIYLRTSSSRKITEYIKDFLPKGKQDFYLQFVNGCKVRQINYLDDLCETTNIVPVGKVYSVANNYSYEIQSDANFASIIIASPSGVQEDSGQKRLMLVFYPLPDTLFIFPTKINYHQWRWATPNPGLILIPNLKNDSQYYFKLNLRPFKIVSEKQIKNYPMKNEYEWIMHPDINLRFYVDSRHPITIYNEAKQVVLGEVIGSSANPDNKYIERSDRLDWKHSYYLSCNDVISRKTQPLIRISLGVYKKDKLMYSDYLVFHIAPAILTPNSQDAKTVYMARMSGVHSNESFVDEATQILKAEGFEVGVLTNPTISMYHRWMQDILKFAYCSDGQKTQFVLLKGPHFAAHTREKGDLSYIYKYFADYPQYDFFYDHSKNLDAFGNVQILPPILPQYPFGRIIYGTSPDNVQQANISYNLVDFLESQQVQKPIHVNTGWLNVGHVDEILSYVPDPKHPMGFRILIASTKRFVELIRGLDPEEVIFDNKDNYYVFDEQISDVTSRFTRKSIDKQPCVYKSQLKVKQLLSWRELIDTNRVYQSYLDSTRKVLMKELNLGWNDFYEIPIYYWPKSISYRAKSIMPNMINNLYLNTHKLDHRGLMLVPKPCACEPQAQAPSQDLFESHFLNQIPTDVKVKFIRNWDSYYLLEGDINCGTNTRRVPFKQPWWSVMPAGAYNID